MNGYALSNTGGNVTGFLASPATSDHRDLSQRCIFHSQVDGGNAFTAVGTVDGKNISSDISGSNASNRLEAFTEEISATRSGAESAGSQ